MVIRLKRIQNLDIGTWIVETYNVVKIYILTTEVFFRDMYYLFDCKILY